LEIVFKCKQISKGKVLGGYLLPGIKVFTIHDLKAKSPLLQAFAYAGARVSRVID
jgi:hypothetical protein